MKRIKLLLFILTSTSLAFIYLYWILLEKKLDGREMLHKYFVLDIISNNSNINSKYEFDEKTRRKSINLKYILIWTKEDKDRMNFFKDGQTSFVESNCKFQNCYVTSNRIFFTRGVSKFDAVAFNGRTITAKDLPKTRSQHQKYIYFNMESADYSPVCNEKFDGFFNWTATYRLDSDIPFLYIAIKNKEGEIIGPKNNMTWSIMASNSDVDDNFSTKLLSKSKAAAWFASHCPCRSNRKQFVAYLQKTLQPYGLSVDVYGLCGTLKCSRNEDMCNSLLERDYFFYMALENSFSEDYVTEKLLRALQHDAVPIVFGGADYFKFLAPGSYLDARKLGIRKLAASMNQLMTNPDLYRSYFSWRYNYTYIDPTEKENVCAVCAALNENRFSEVTVYEQFRKWWNPGYEKRCKWLKRT